MAGQYLKTQLAEADLRLKRMERWVHAATVLATIATVLSVGFGVFLSISQRRLSEAQALEAVEKQRVSFSFRLSPILLPSGDQFYIRAKLRNLSVRELTVLMIGLRVWQGDKWDDNISVGENTDAAIIADNLVSDCPSSLCKTDWSKGRLRLRKLTDQITLEATEGDSELSFGPYPITKDQVNRGLWLEGSAYVTETDHGPCAIHTLEAPSLGELPYVCEARTNNQAKCYEDARCSNATGPATFYSKGELAKLSQ